MTRATLSRSWPLLALVAIASVWFARYGQRNLNFQTDEVGYLLGSRTLREGFPDSLTSLTLVGRGLQRLNMVLLAGAFEVSHAPTAFTLFHYANAFAFSSAAIPIYLLVRMLDGSRVGAWLAALLSLLIPWAVTSASLLAEGTAYPVFAWALWAMSRALAAPSKGGDLVAVAALALAPLARTSFLVLPAAFVAAMVVAELAAGDGHAWPKARALPRRLVRHHPVALGALTLAAAYAMWHSRAVGGIRAEVTQWLGVYDSATHTGWSVTHTILRSGYFTSRLVVGIGVVPWILGLAWLLSAARRGPSQARRGFALVGLACAAAVLVTSVPSSLDERYALYLAPVFVVAAAVAAQDAVRSRPGRPTPLEVMASAALAAGLVFHYAWDPRSGDAYAFFAYPAQTFFARDVLAHAPGVLGARTWAALLVLVLGALTARATAGRGGHAGLAAIALIASIVGLAAIQTHSTLSHFVTQAGAADGPSASQRAFIDRYTQGSGWVVAASGLASDAEYVPIWSEARFHNPDLDGQLAFGGHAVAPLYGPYASAIPGTFGPDGRILRPSHLPRFIAEPTLYHDVELAGRQVAVGGYVPVSLIELSEPPSIAWRLAGPDGDGWIRAGVAADATFFHRPGSPSECATFVLEPAPGGRIGAFSLAGQRTPEQRGRAAAPGARETLSVALAEPSQGTAAETLTLRVSGQTTLPDGRRAAARIVSVAAGSCPPSVRAL